MAAATTRTVTDDARAWAASWSYFRNADGPTRVSILQLQIDSYRKAASISRHRQPTVAAEYDDAADYLQTLLPA